ncbi:hypothetical protein [Marinobacter sp. F3R08]|uniref:hypothetical protein n=1 Tax=Marinobacter sp. F3R08 TaxID=2841559 RepID=UPI001C08499B|nr:hypothetical protein [Marinobacter sp. F3R08]MBU2955826.1 hypothetical protein [Marinobacter sp. F3R08]
MEQSDVSRKELYYQVWKSPMIEVAAKYGVSSSYLARVCNQLNVPRPERGHWAKLAAGHTVKVPPLPPAKPSHDLVWCRSGILDPTRNVIPPKPLSPRRRSSHRKKSVPKDEIHPLIRGARELFLKGRETENGYLKPYKWNLVDIITSREKLDTALNIANCLFLEFENRSWDVRLEAFNKQFRRPEADDRPRGGNIRYGVRHWSPGRSTLVLLGTVAIGLTLIEDSEEIEVVYVDGKYVPTSRLKKTQSLSRWPTKRDLPSGRFRLRAYSPYIRTQWQREWSIREGQDLTNFAQKVARELRKATSDITEEFAVATEQIRKEKQEWAEQREKWRIEEDNKLRREAMTKSTESLDGIISDWGRAKTIHQFFDELETAIGLSLDDDEALLHDRLRAARDLMRIPDALEALKAWKSPEEIYDEKRKPS